MFKNKKLKKDLSHLQDSKRYNQSDFDYEVPKDLDDVNWWDSRNRADMQDEVLPSRGKMTFDTPDEMGYFETKTMGTVSVGYDRDKENSDLSFTVVSEKDKNRRGVPEVDAKHPSTYFKGNFSGKQVPFEAGKVSFKYSRASGEVSEVIDEDDKDLSHQDKEKERLEKIKQEELEEPREILGLDRDSENVKRIRDEERKKEELRKEVVEKEKTREEKIKENNEDLSGEISNEIKSFVKDLDRWKIKRIIGADEMARDKKRITEMLNETFFIIRMRKRLEELLSRGIISNDEFALMFEKVKSKQIGESDIEKIELANLENILEDEAFNEDDNKSEVPALSEEPRIRQE